MAKRSPKTKTTKKSGTVYCNILTTRSVMVDDEKNQPCVMLSAYWGQRVPVLHLDGEVLGISLSAGPEKRAGVQITSQESGMGVVGLSVSSDGGRGFFVTGEAVFTVFFAGIGMNRESQIELRNPVTGPVREVVPATAETKPVFQVDVPDVIWEVHGKQTWPMEGYKRPWEK